MCYTPLRIEVYEKTQAFIATTYLHRKEVARLHTYVQGPPKPDEFYEKASRALTFADV